VKSKLFKDLKAAMEDVAAHQRGELELDFEIIVIPEPPAEYKPRQIKKIREINNYSQSIFAKVLNVSVKTVQSWESGQRVPSHAALRLLEVVDKGLYRPQIVHSGRK
jgi:putative transcriptional regulator